MARGCGDFEVAFGFVADSSEAVAAVAGSVAAAVPGTVGMGGMAAVGKNGRCWGGIEGG